MSALDQTSRVAIVLDLLGKKGDDVLQALACAGYPAEFLDDALARYSWTSTLPTDPGSYWWIYCDAGPSVIELDDFGEWFKPGFHGPFVPPAGSYFSGPIVCPGSPLEVSE